ncbi:MAG: host attachment protein [Rhodobacteraceae bacterium]|jgi:protein required for attachment to host cells|nr:host attachment protein [Paracoccaceae bacterium]
MRPVRTLVMLASEGAARLLVNEGVGRGLSETGALAAGDFPDVDVGHADRPGRGSAGPGEMALHGLDPHATEREQRRERFAEHVVAWLAGAWEGGGYDRLIVAAPPRFLGELRAALPPALAGAVTADLPKDLVKLPLRELPAHFAGVAAF